MTGFHEIMKEKSDEELLDIIENNQDEYRTEAIDAVKQLLEERNITYYIKTAKEKEAELSDAEFAYEFSWWKRYFGNIVDNCAMYLILFIIVLLLDNGSEDFLWICMLTVYFSYYIVFEYYLSQKTLGKMIFGLKVIDIYGNKPTFKQILIRTLLRFVPFDSVTFISFGWHKHQLTGAWHDKYSKTYVVSEKKLKDRCYA